MRSRTHTPTLKRAINEQVARLGHATSNPTRLELLDLLAQAPRTVEVLAGLTGQSVATVSHHLQVLRRARLVDGEKAGLYVTYRLADAAVGDFLVRLRRLADARLAEVQRITHEYLDARHALEPVDNDELVRRVRGGEVTLLDVRPEEEYRAGHIPGALSVPVDDLKSRLRELPKDREVVAYCRGPYCVMAIDAVEFLRRRGYRAHRLEHGVPDWRSRGWKVAVGPGRASGPDR